MEVKKALAKLGFGALVCAVAIPSLSHTQVEAASQSSDIVVIMVDDLGDSGSKRVLNRLPAIQHTFVGNGTQYTEMYSETPLCAPGRGTFLTGQFTFRHGVWKNKASLLKESRTIAVALDSVGYETYLLGKYLNQYDGSGKPEGWDRTALFYRGVDKLINLPARFMKEAPEDKPVFILLTPTAPHAEAGSNHPFVPEQYRGATACRGISPFKPPNYRVWKNPREFPYNMPYWPNGQKMQRICESLLPVDESLANIRKAQASRNRPAHYIFLSDNGMAWGQKGSPGKHVPVSTALPFFWSGPGIANGAQSGKLLSLMDVSPTIAEIAGASMPWADGKSFLPLLQGENFPGRQCVFETYRHAKFQWSGLRCKNWHYIRWNSGRKELYRASDVWEMRNLARSKPALVQDMNQKLNRRIQNSKS